MPDLNASVTSTLGYLRTDTTLSQDYSELVLTVSKDAVAKAQNIWDGYLKSAGWPATGAGSTIPAGYSGVYAPAPSCDSALPSVYPMRVADASYYFALEFIAEEYTRIKIGNVGAQTPVAQLVLSKAEHLLSIAKEGIARYEQWCATEAGVSGANSMALIDDAATAGFDGFEQAKSIWESTVSDDDTLDDIFTLPAAYQDRIQHATYGYALRLLSTKVAQRAMGYSGARLPAIASYYQQQAQMLLAAGDKLVQEFLAWTLDTKQVLLAVKAYKKRDNAYGVVSLTAGIVPSKTESLFKVRSLVTGQAATFTPLTQDLYLVLYSMDGSAASVFWYNRATQAFSLPVEVLSGNILAPSTSTVPACPPAGVYKGELVVMQKGTQNQVGSFEVFVNIENPAATAFGAAMTLRTMRQIVDSEVATAPGNPKSGLLDFDDALLCRAAFNACDDWNTLLPDFPRKVQPSSFKETALFRQGILAHAFQIKGAALMRSAMGVADVKASNVHAFEQKKADQYMQMGQALLKAYRNDVVATQRRIWNHWALS